MRYENHLNSLNREISRKYHFTDYDFKGVLEIEPPRPEKTEWLTEQFIRIMTNLKDFIRTEPTKKEIAEFITLEYKKLDSTQYLKSEFELLILKYNGFNHFCLGIGILKEMFDAEKDNLKYCT